MLSIPGALLFFRLLIAFRISFFVGGEQSISSLSPKGWDIQAALLDLAPVVRRVDCTIQGIA